MKYFNYMDYEIITNQNDGAIQFSIAHVVLAQKITNIKKVKNNMINLLLKKYFWRF